MSQIIPDVSYICSRKDLEALLEDTCITVLDVLDYPLNKPERETIRREMQAALDEWHARTTTLLSYLEQL